MRASDVWNVTYGCVFLALNTAVALAPVCLLGRRFGDHPAALGGGAALGLAGSFALGGTWFVLLPQLWKPPPPPDHNPWFWFCLAGGFSVADAAAGCTVVAVVAAGWSWLRRVRPGRAERGAAANAGD